MDLNEIREYRPFWIVMACIWASMILGWVGAAVSGSLIPVFLGAASAAIFTFVIVLLAIEWSHRHGIDLGLGEGLVSSVQVEVRSPPGELTAGLASKDPDVIRQSKAALNEWAKDVPPPQIRMSRQQALSKGVGGGLPNGAFTGTMRCASCNAQIPLGSSKCIVCGANC